MFDIKRIFKRSCSSPSSGKVDEKEVETRSERQEEFLRVMKIFPVTQKMYPFVKGIEGKKLWMSEDKNISGIIHFGNMDEDRFIRLDNCERPCLIKGEDDDSTKRVAVWTREKAPAGVESMVVLQEDVLKDKKGNIVGYVPRKITYGRWASFVMFYKIYPFEGEEEIALIGSVNYKNPEKKPLFVAYGTWTSSGMNVFYNGWNETYNVHPALSDSELLYLERVREACVPKEP